LLTYLNTFRFDKIKPVRDACIETLKVIKAQESHFNSATTTPEIQIFTPEVKSNASIVVPFHEETSPRIKLTKFQQEEIKSSVISQAASLSP
jgi:hypothetical protein